MVILQGMGERFARMVIEVATTIFHGQNENGIAEGVLSCFPKQRQGGMEVTEDIVKS